MDPNVSKCIQTPLTYPNTCKYTQIHQHMSRHKCVPEPPKPTVKHPLVPNKTMRGHRHPSETQTIPERQFGQWPMVAWQFGLVSTHLGLCVGAAWPVLVTKAMCGAVDGAVGASPQNWCVCAFAIFATWRPASFVAYVGGL